MSNAKNCEGLVVCLEEWEKEEKTKGLERDSTCFSVGSFEREK